jgi:CRP/FNR family transcriptional regulator
LSEFQRRDWIKQTRGNVELLDEASIARLAQSEAA